MEELMAFRSDDVCSSILQAFSAAHHKGHQDTGSEEHARSFIGLEERQILLLGKLQRFRDQGDAMCNLSSILRLLGRHSEAAVWSQRVRDVGAAHGFFSLESSACIGLGTTALEEGRHEEGLALLRNALVAAELNELDDPAFELDAVKTLIDALFSTNLIDEVEPLVFRYREAAKAQSEEKRILIYAALDSVFCSARLHEVLCMRYACGTPGHSSVCASSTAM